MINSLRWSYCRLGKRVHFLLTAQRSVISLEMIISQNSITLTLFRNYMSQIIFLEYIFCLIYQKNILQSESWRIMFTWSEKQKKSGWTTKTKVHSIILPIEHGKEHLLFFPRYSVKRFDKFTDHNKDNGYFRKKKNGKKRQRQLDQTTARRMSKEKRKEKDKQHETF